MEEDIIICNCNEIYKSEIVKAIKEKGLNVPEDISVIGFDNIVMGNYIMPSLTTVDAPLQSIAKVCIESLSYFCKNKYFERNEIRVNTDLVIRESTKAI